MPLVFRQRQFVVVSCLQRNTRVSGSDFSTLSFNSRQNWVFDLVKEANKQARVSLLCGELRTMHAILSAQTVLFNFNANSGFRCNYVARASSSLNSNTRNENLNTETLEERSQEVDISVPRLLTPRKKKKRWQWSTGTGPGEYGGPPAYIDPKPLRREQRDPVLTRDDFIWNKQWQGAVQITPPEVVPQTEPQKQREEAGFICLSRAMALNSLEIDLSHELVPSVKEKSVNQESTEHGTFSTKRSDANRQRWRSVPGPGKQQQRRESKKSVTGGTRFMMPNMDNVKSDPTLTAAQSRKQYDQLKQKLQFITLGLGGIGTFSTYLSYSPEAAASFGIGLVGSLAYLRMLCRSVDSFGVKGIEGTVKRAVGQPRLLVPVILAMFYNRWNEILVPEYGFIHLELIPLLIGFFTYKVATFIQTIEDILPTFQGSEKS